MIAGKELVEAPFIPWPEKPRYRRKLVNAKGQEKQHRLLRSSAVTLTVAQVARLSEGEAFEAFCRIRFYENGGQPFCPHCDSRVKIYPIRARRIFKCGVCEKQFSATSGTSFNSRKMSFGDILLAALTFANADSGIAAIRLRKHVGCSYKTSFTLCHKLREAMGLSRERRQLKGEVEVDGCVFPQRVRGPNIKNKAKTDARQARAQSTQQVVVVARERGEFGQSRTGVYLISEERAIPDLVHTLAPDCTLVTDNGGWSRLGLICKRHEVANHSIGLKVDGVASNQAESFFARLRRLERGVHYGIRGRQLDLYAQEASWREDHRHFSNGEQWFRLLHAMTHLKTSKRWSGYWQRWQGPDARKRDRGQRISWRVGYGHDLPRDPVGRLTSASDCLDAIPLGLPLHSVSSPPEC